MCDIRGNLYLKHAWRKKLSLLYGMLLTIIFAHFNALIYHFKSKKPAPISTTMVKLVQLDTSTFHPQSSQPLLVASSATQIVPPFLGQSSSQPSSSILQSTHFFTSPFSLRDFLNLNSPHPQSASPPPPLPIWPTPSKSTVSSPYVWPTLFWIY